VVKEAEVVAVAEEAVKEPEVVGKGKKPEEGETAEPAKGDAKGAAKDTKPAAKEPNLLPKRRRRSKPRTLAWTRH